MFAKLNKIGETKGSIFYIKRRKHQKRRKNRHFCRLQTKKHYLCITFFQPSLFEIIKNKI